MDFSFAQWLEANNKWGILSWDGKRWYESSHMMGDRAEIKVTWRSNGKVDVEVGPRHPMLKRALKVLLRQRPEFRDAEIEFDGYSPGTVGEFIKGPTRPPWEMPRYFYQGTSMDRWDRIQDEGLVPRSETGVNPAYGAHISSAKPSNPDYVYLGGSPGSACSLAAHDAARLDKSQPVMLRIDSRGMRKSKLRPDEDAIPRGDLYGNHDWQYSMKRLDSVGYEGSIDPKFIELYKVWDKKWVDPPPPPEPDWLAKQVMGMGGSDYQTVPGTTSAKYKWANPRED